MRRGGREGGCEGVRVWVCERERGKDAQKGREREGQREEMCMKV